MSIIEILLLLAIFGGGAAIIAAIALMIAKGRAGAVLLIGGLLLIGAPLAMLTLYWMAASVSRGSVRSGEEATVHFVNTYPENKYRTIDSDSRPSPIRLTRDTPTWAIALTPLILLGIAVIAIVVFAGRHGFAHAAAGGHARIWLALLALVVLGMFLMSGVRIQSRSSTGRNADMGAMLRQQQDSFAAQQQAFARRAAAVSAKAQKQVENVNIHELMDQVDAPRIALQSSSSASTESVEEIPAASEVVDDDTNNGDKASKPKQKLATKSGGSSKTSEKSAGEDAVAESAGEPAAKAAGDPAKKSTADSKPATESARPSWVDASPGRPRDLRREVIATEEYESTDECYLAADVYLMLKAYERMQHLIGHPYGGQRLPSITFRDNMVLADDKIIYVTGPNSGWSDVRLAQLSNMGITPEFLRNEIVAKDPGNNELCEYMETSTRSFGPMKKLYMQIEFTPTVERDLRRSWEAQIRKDRFAYVGTGAASVLGLLGMIWGLIKFDTATKGYYSKWLFIGAPAAIIGVASWALAVALL